MRQWYSGSPDSGRSLGEVESSKPLGRVESSGSTGKALRLPSGKGDNGRPLGKVDNGRALGIVGGRGTAREAPPQRQARRGGQQLQTPPSPFGIGKPRDPRADLDTLPPELEDWEEWEGMPGSPERPSVDGPDPHKKGHTLRMKPMRLSKVLEFERLGHICTRWVGHMCLGLRVVLDYILPGFMLHPARFLHHLKCHKQ